MPGTAFAVQATTAEGDSPELIASSGDWECRPELDPPAATSARRRPCLPRPDLGKGRLIGVYQPDERLEVVSNSPA